MLKRLCTGWVPASSGAKTEPSRPLSDGDEDEDEDEDDEPARGQQDLLGLGGTSLQGDLKDKAAAEEFIHIFVNKPDHLLQFLEFIVQEGEATEMVYNTLLELYLSRSASTGDKAVRAEYQRSAMDLLQDEDADYDKSHALVLVKTHNFSDGVLFLYERLKLYHEVSSLDTLMDR